MSKHFDRVNNRTRAVQASNYTDNRPTVYRMDEPVQADNVESQGYDSLLGYWHILVRNKVTLLCFALAGLALPLPPHAISDAQAAEDRDTARFRGTFDRLPFPAELRRSLTNTCLREGLHVNC